MEFTTCDLFIRRDRACYGQPEIKKRLRKKKRVGEFQEFGFDVESSLRPNMDREVHAFTDRFIAHIEAHKLEFGGGIGTTVSGFVTRFGRGSATQEDRERVTSFFGGDPDVVQHKIRRCATPVRVGGAISGRNRRSA